MGAQWLSGRVLDSRPKGRGFEPHRRHCVVSLSKNSNPSLVLVQPRKTRPFITERLLMGRKESNQTNKTKASSEIQPTTMTPPPSTTPDIDATNCATTETSPKKNIKVALILTTTDAVHVVYWFLFNGWHLFSSQMKA